MKAEQIIRFLGNRLPTFSTYFSDVVDISSISKSGAIATVTTNGDHQLAQGNQIYISDVLATIDIDSISRVGTILTVVTNRDHDATEGISDEVEILGATEPEFNGIFPILSVPNSRTIKFKVDDSGPNIGSTGELANASRFDESYDGLFTVSSVVSSNQFTFESTSSVEQTYSTGKVHRKIRISGAATIERAIQAFTEDKTNRAWCFVVLGDSVSSKSRDTRTDLTARIQRGEFFQQILAQSVSLYVMTGTKNELSGRLSRDDMVDVHYALMRCLASRQFDTPLAVQKTNPMIFIGHGIYEYSAAVYIHEFQFETAVEITFKDTVGYDDDVAFRDINFELTSQIGPTPVVANIELGESDEN